MLLQKYYLRNIFFALFPCMNKQQSIFKSVCFKVKYPGRFSLFPFLIFSRVLCEMFNDKGIFYWCVGSNSCFYFNLPIYISCLHSLTWESTSCALRTWYQEGYLPATSSLLRKSLRSVSSFGISLLTARASVATYLVCRFKTLSQNTKRDALIFAAWRMLKIA
jgi:hypothetical protein